jgi:hypothetical protein
MNARSRLSTITFLAALVIGGNASALRSEGSALKPGPATLLSGSEWKLASQLTAKAWRDGLPPCLPDDPCPFGKAAGAPSLQSNGMASPAKIRRDGVPLCLPDDPCPFGGVTGTPNGLLPFSQLTAEVRRDGLPLCLPGECPFDKQASSPSLHLNGTPR